MSRRFLTGLLILVCLSLIASECYAWPPKPDVYISDWHKYTPVGEDVDVYAEVVNYEVAGPIDYWDWTKHKPSALYFSGSPVENDYNSTATFYSYTPGQYKVYADGFDYYDQNDSDWAYVYVIDVEIDTPSSFPAYVALGDNLQLDCTPLGATGGTYSWSKVTGPGTVTFSDPNAKNPTFSANQSGNYTVKVEYTKEEATASDTSGTITVVEVDINAGLSEQDELDPGKYINVNWDDDDNDGWQPDDTPPGGTYTGDKSDPNIDVGDNDFRSFIVSISPQQTIVEDFPNSKVSITFPSKVKVWQTNTKKTVLGESSELTSGAQFNVENLPKQLYLEGVSGSSTFKDVELKATWLPYSFNDIVKITVFEVELTGLFGYGNQQDDNDKKHSTFRGSSDKNGKISWDDANADGIKGDNDPNCEYFHNCMEFQGAVKPSDVTNEVVFDIKRKKWVKVWQKLEDANEWGDPVVNWTPWQDDDQTNNDEDLTPSGANHIYSLDGPGFAAKERTATYDCRAYIGNFREWVMVEINSTWYQCSDYSKWHTKLYTEPKDDDYMTRDALGLQQLGSGWITVPDSP